MNYPVPTNEDERIAVLNRLGILDTEPDDSFDRITALAKDIFDVSSAAVSMIDRDRQWFKSMYGWDREETSRESSFCTYTILEDDVMVVEDAANDPRFEANPHVIDGPVQFYAGAPLRVGRNSLPVGTLCLTDDRPRSFGPGERERLSTLASIVVELLEAHQMAHQIGYLKSALEGARDAVVITEGSPIDSPGPRIVWTNAAFSRMTGYERGELIGKTPRVLQGPKTSQDVLDKVRRALEDRRAVDAETVNYRKDGTPYVVAWHIAPVRDDQGELTHWVSIQRDVTDQLRREEQLKHRATHDALTGLPNREAIQRKISELITTSDLESTHQGALLYIDLDSFKPINDEYGHSLGDDLLQHTAERLRSVLREDDGVGRIGGDEFVVCLTETYSPDEVREIAERIYDTLAKPYRLGSQSVQITASIGAAVGVCAYPTVENVLEVADEAMYEAKENPNRKVVMRTSPDEIASRSPA